MKEIDWEILIKYLDGTSSESENLQVSEWILSSTSAKEEFERIKKIWNVEAQNLDRPDLDKALNNIMSRIQINKKSVPIFNLSESGKKGNILSSILKSNWIRAAALILIPIGAVYIYLTIQNINSIQQYQVSNSSIDSLLLGDGTKVILDAGSSLKYPEKFNGTERRVELKGEAFFSVTRNEAAPFVIKAEQGLVKVLGTKFNVRAWKEENEVTVSVEEGKVLFHSDVKQNFAQGVVLTNGKMSRLDDSGNISAPVDIDFTLLKSWMKKEFYFINSPLHNIIAQLERWYDVKFEVTNSSILQNKITVYIQNRSLEENVKVIAEVLGATYELKENIVKLSFR